METDVSYETGPGATWQHSLIQELLLLFGPVVVYLEIICKSLADLRDHTRHGQETRGVSAEPLLVMNAAIDATLCFFRAAPGSLV